MQDLAFINYLSANDFSQMEGGLVNKKHLVRAALGQHKKPMCTALVLSSLTVLMCSCKMYWPVHKLLIVFLSWYTNRDCYSRNGIILSTIYAHIEGV